MRPSIDIADAARPVADAAEPVVLVHGLWLQPGFMRTLGRRLAAQGYRPLYFSYPSARTEVHHHADALRRFLEALDTPAHLVGHSLGGLVILHSLQAGAHAVRRVVLLGTPLVSCRAAAGLARWRWGRSLLGGSAQPGGLLGPFPPQWTGPQPLGVVAGRLKLGLGRMLVSFDEPNDGTVAVAETELPGTTDRIVLPVSHFGLLYSQRVAEQTAEFLRRGRFGEGEELRRID